MTFRAKTTRAKGRTRSRFWEGEDRQRLLVSVGFVGIIVIAALILVGTVAAGYYNDHLVAVITVNGTQINKDTLNTRIAVDSFQLDHLEAQIRSAVSAGKVDATTANTQIQAIEQQRSLLLNQALNDLIDQTLLEQLAPTIGVSVSQADIDQKLKETFGTPEARHVLAVVVQPQVSAGATVASDAQVQFAATMAHSAANALKSGQDFATVVKTYSTDATSKAKGGDLGTIAADDQQVDPSFLKAVFAAPLNGITDPVLGADGAWRIGKVVSITPAQPDPNLQSDISSHVDYNAYIDALRGSIFKQKIEDKVIAMDSTGDVEQVHAFEILVSANGANVQSTFQDEVKVSHILYSPNGDANAATTLPASDPAWAAAKAKADAAAAKLRAITDLTARETMFAALAKTDSNDTGSGASGGDLGWQPRGTFVTAFDDAVFKGTHQVGDIIGPVKTQYGYHVILWMGHRDAPDKRAQAILDEVLKPGADFSAIAKKESDGLEGAKGGDLGWIARGMSSDPQEEAKLFSLKAGQTASTYVVLSDGFHIYRVTAIEKKPVTSDQLNLIQANAFNDWYTPLKAKASIWEDPTLASQAQQEVQAAQSQAGSNPTGP